MPKSLRPAERPQRDMQVRSVAVRAAALAMVLLGAMGLNTAAADGTCIRFYNENPNVPVYHVSFDLDAPNCPTGTCWQTDVRLGEMNEYCPGELVYPPPGLPFSQGFKLVFSRDGNYWGERHGSLSRDRTTLCHITVTADGHPAFRDCGPLHIY